MPVSRPLSSTAHHCLLLSPFGKSRLELISNLIADASVSGSLEDNVLKESSDSEEFTFHVPDNGSVELTHTKRQLASDYSNVDVVNKSSSEGKNSCMFVMYVVTSPC